MPRSEIRGLTGLFPLSYSPYQHVARMQQVARMQRSEIRGLTGLFPGCRPSVSIRATRLLSCLHRKDNQAAQL